MKTLPEPDGPYFVGTTAGEVTDSGRPAHVLSQNRGRKLYIKIWYPADPPKPVCEPERLWTQLRSEPDIPGFAKLLLRPAMKMMTNSHQRAPYAADVGVPRILIYCHGLISFASENTMLMEYLASHGYTLTRFSIRISWPSFRRFKASRAKARNRYRWN